MKKGGYSLSPHSSKLKIVHDYIFPPTGHHSTPEKTQLIFQSIPVSQRVRHRLLMINTFKAVTTWAVVGIKPVHAGSQV